MGGGASKLAAAKEANTQVGSLAGKQSIIFGGTSGIGQAIGERLAKGGANVTIVGRNEKVGLEIVEGMTQKHPEGRHTFLKADVSLTENCIDVVNRFEQQMFNVSNGEVPPYVDYVVFCQTKATFQGRTETKDGIDEKLALNFYSRVFLSNLLLNMMENAANMPEHGDPRVMSVLSAGAHAPYKLYESDPYLSEKNYSQKLAADITSFYSDLWVDKASKENPAVTYVHACPGFVNTNWGTDLPGYAKGPIRVLQACAAKPASDCAELLLQGLVDPARKGGFHLIGEYGQDVKKTDLHTPEAVEKVAADTKALLEKLYPEPHQ